VGEKQYDQARREIKTIKYNTQIDLGLLESLTTEQLIKLMPTKIDPANDKVEYRIPDAKNQTRFTIDAGKYISEKRYDNNGNVIARISYATKLTDPQSIAKLLPDQVLSNIKLDAINDRAVYQVFDSRHNPEYVVNGEGIVTQFWHDKDNNLIKTCVYDSKITVPVNYDELKILLKH